MWAELMPGYKKVDIEREKKKKKAEYVSYKTTILISAGHALWLKCFRRLITLQRLIDILIRQKHINYSIFEKFKEYFSYSLPFRAFRDVSNLSVVPKETFSFSNIFFLSSHHAYLC